MTRLRSSSSDGLRHFWLFGCFKFCFRFSVVGAGYPCPIRRARKPPPYKPGPGFQFAFSKVEKGVGRNFEGKEEGGGEFRVIVWGWQSVRLDHYGFIW